MLTQYLPVLSGLERSILRLDFPIGVFREKSSADSLQKRDIVSLAVGLWYYFHEFGCHLGNVEFRISDKEICRIRTSIQQLHQLYETEHDVAHNSYWRRTAPDIFIRPNRLRPLERDGKSVPCASTNKFSMPIWNGCFQPRLLGIADCRDVSCLEHLLEAQRSLSK